MKIKRLSLLILCMWVISAMPCFAGSSFVETNTYYNSSANVTYTTLYSNDSVPFETLVSEAKRLGGNIVSFSDSNEISSVKGMAGTEAYVGFIRDNGDETTGRWVSQYGLDNAEVAKDRTAIFANPGAYLVLSNYGFSSSYSNRGRAIIAEFPGKVEWKQDEIASDGSNRYIEHRYLNGAKTDEMRYVGGTQFDTRYTAAREDWKVDSYTTDEVAKIIERQYLDGKATNKTRTKEKAGLTWKYLEVKTEEPYVTRYKLYDNGSPVEVYRDVPVKEIKWEKQQLKEYIAPYYYTEELYLDGKATGKTRQSSEMAKAEWKLGTYSITAPYEYEERLFVDGNWTDISRKSGKYAQKTEKTFLEEKSPYRYYVKIYLEGKEQPGIVYTGKTAKAEWKRQSGFNKETGEYKDVLYLDGNKTAVVNIKSGTWKKTGSNYTLYVDGKSTGVTQKSNFSLTVTKGNVTNILNKKWFKYGSDSIKYVKSKSVFADGDRNIIFETSDGAYKYGLEGNSTWIEYYYVPYKNAWTTMGWTENARYTIKYSLDGKQLNFIRSSGTIKHTNTQTVKPQPTTTVSSSGSSTSSGSSSSTSNGEATLAVIHFERPTQLMNSWDVKDIKVTSDNYKVYINNSTSSASIHKGTDTKISGTYAFSCLVTDGDDNFYVNGSFYLEKGKTQVTIKFNLHDDELTYSAY